MPKIKKFRATYNFFYRETKGKQTLEDKTFTQKKTFFGFTLFFYTENLTKLNLLTEDCIIV